jgi:hypothetical protein
MPCAPHRLLPPLALIALGLNLAVLPGPGRARAEGEYVPVGTYLYANPADPERVTGGLTVRFETPGKRLVVAYGRQNRKDRLARSDTIEAQREWFKPFKAESRDGGRTAVFPHLPPDFYDLVVIETDTMRLFEGVDLLTEDSPDLAGSPFFGEVQQSLSRRTDRIAGGWEAFFDTRAYERFETDGVRGAVFVQQLRKGQTYAESGALIQGCIHSIDVVWVVRGKSDDAGWQVLQRQQLFREELPSRELFSYRFCPELQGIRVGLKMKDLGVLLKKAGD